MPSDTELREAFIRKLTHALQQYTRITYEEVEYKFQRYPELLTGDEGVPDIQSDNRFRKLSRKFNGEVDTLEKYDIRDIFERIAEELREEYENQPDSHDNDETEESESNDDNPSSDESESEDSGYSNNNDDDSVYRNTDPRPSEEPPTRLDSL